MDETLTRRQKTRMAAETAVLDLVISFPVAWFVMLVITGLHMVMSIFLDVGEQTSGYWTFLAVVLAANWALSAVRLWREWRRG